MEKQYDPRAIERRLYEQWEESGAFAPAGSGAPYCIMIPPPNVTGTLHMGHAFQDTLMDALIRRRRMRGDRTLWQAGSDHAGIATQMVVERQLAAEGKSRHDLGRERFIERIWEWKGRSGNAIATQLRRMGASLDWSRERFTMDDGLSAAVREVFVRLHEEGLIYRGKRLVNWDPVLRTAVSDLEVAASEEAGHLWHLRYPLVDGEGHLIVATTRPETMLGDAAVAVHPDDERYASLVGKRVELPLTGRTIPVIADAYVDPAFGSGCVKITPAHDFNDYAVGERHDLPRINVLTADAAINDQAPERYRGLDRYAARKQIVADLEARGLLERVEAHRMAIPRGDRSGAALEPYLTDQWFVDLTRDAQPDGRPGGQRAIVEPALAAVRDGRIRFVPENWSKTYFHWMENIQDWCISRQIWWGHRIPAWYDADGNCYVARSEEEARKKHSLDDGVILRQDADVLDTWFSSALWPFSTLGWPDETPELAAFYPTSVLVTGFDILFFWVARMAMMGLKFTGKIPFHEVYIHGLVRDAHGQKMSKSKGNVLDPLDLIDGIDAETLIAKRTAGLMQPKMRAQIERATRKEFPNGIASYGTDALRLTFASLASTGRDINFDLGRVEGHRNFCNKLWNAARYVALQSEGRDCGQSGGEIALSVADRWIVGRLHETIATIDRAFDAYRFDLAARAFHDFVWNLYCDWYLELAKPLLNDDAVDAAAQRGARHTLVRVLETALRLGHPLMPFITEALWRRIAPLTGAASGEPSSEEAATAMLQPWPVADAARIDAAADAEIAWLQALVLGVRRIRGEMDIAPGKPLPALLRNASPQDRARLVEHRRQIDALARLESITLLEAGESAPEAATALIGEMELLIPMAGLIDKAAELARLDRELERLTREEERLRSKLANADFVARAPAAVVEKERARLAEAQDAVARLRGQRERIERV